jgi:hypothetical protein
MTRCFIPRGASHLWASRFALRLFLFGPARRHLGSWLLGRGNRLARLVPEFVGAARRPAICLPDVIGTFADAVFERHGGWRHADLLSAIEPASYRGRSKSRQAANQPAEIVGQFMAARDAYGDWPGPAGESQHPLSSIVLMGTGKPLYDCANVAKAMTTAIDKNGTALSRRRLTFETSC